MKYYLGYQPEYKRSKIVYFYQANPGLIDKLVFFNTQLMVSIFFNHSNVYDILLKFMSTLFLSIHSNFILMALTRHTEWLCRFSINVK